MCTTRRVSLMSEAEIVGFDGDGVVIEGGVSPDVLDEARSRKAAAGEPDTLRECIESVLRERGEL